MALAINPAVIAELPRTAGAIVARAVAQQLSSTQVRKIQQLLQLGDFVGGLLGLSEATEGIAQPLLGGLTLANARDTYTQLRDAQLARKNLWFIRVTDHNPPSLPHLDGAPAASYFNLFATDVSYPRSTLTGEKVAIGSAMMDRIAGTEAIELAVSTMDDSKGTLKHWFDAKYAQAAQADGTFGVPADYWVDIEVFHASPFDNAQAYRLNARMRTNGIQHELSRREQAMQEIQMTFSQVDTFILV